MATTIRQQRVAEMLFQELTILIGNELSDPRLSLVQVTHVNVSRDLRNVSVHVSHEDDEVSQRQVLTGLRNATPYLRRQIAARCALRVVPELSFHYDDTPERAARVEALLRKIAEERDQSAPESANTDGPETGHTSPPAQ